MIWKLRVEWTFLRTIWQMCKPICSIDWIRIMLLKNSIRSLRQQKNHTLTSMDYTLIHYLPKISIKYTIRRKKALKRIGMLSIWAAHWRISRRSRSRLRSRWQSYHKRCRAWRNACRQSRQIGPISISPLKRTKSLDPLELVIRAVKDQKYTIKFHQA